MAGILVLEDDAFLREGVTALLEKEGYAVTAERHLRGARERIAAERFDLYLLDVLLPDGDGYAFCEELRRAGDCTPILFVTACDEEEDIVRGLDAGGDDYVTKPFRLKELLSRVRALLRRGSAEVVESRGITLDLDRLSVKKDGQTVPLTPTEFQILSVLLRNRGVIVTRGQLLERVWDSDGNYIDDNTLSVHISRLREKIGAAAIVTVRGVGYRWEGTV